MVSQLDFILLSPYPEVTNYSSREYPVSLGDPLPTVNQDLRSITHLGRTKSQA